jgi:hypothetical protein
VVEQHTFPDHTRSAALLWGWMRRNGVTRSGQMHDKTLRVALSLALFALACFAPAPALCQDGPTLAALRPREAPRVGAREAPHFDARSVGWGLAGFATGFLAHEAGHVVANLMLGNVPEFEGFLVWGFLPFFAIAPNIDCADGVCIKQNGQEFGAGPRGKYAIVSAGYNVQHISDEIILTRSPDLVYKHAPYRKGILLFNVFLSCMYSVGVWTGLQDPHGDLAGMGRASGYSEVGLSMALMLPAILDTYRFFVPSHSRWSAWLSRGSKLAFVGITLTF